MSERFLVHFARATGVLQQRLDLGREQELLADARVEQRLLAQSVAGYEQFAAAAVPDGEGEHADQVVEAALAVFLVGVHDGLGVRARGESMPQPFQFVAQLDVAIDFAVE